MGLHDFVRLLRRYAVLIVLVTLLGGAGAAAASYGTAATFQASTQLFVSTPDAAQSVGSEFSSGVLAGQRIATYAALANSPEVTQAVAAQIGEPHLAGRLAGEISAVHVTDTLLIDVTVKDSSATRAQRVANAVGDNLETAVRSIEAGAPSASAPVTIRVVRPAAFDPVAISPNHRLDTSLGLVLGLVVGVGAALLFNALSTTVHSLRDLGGGVDPPLLAVVPRARRRRSADAEVEAYAELRTALQFHGPHRPRSVVIAGPTGEEGATATVVALGRAFARAGARVLVIDANLRRPGLAAALSEQPGPGLGDVLSGATDLAGATTQLEPNLALLRAGTAVAAPSELLGSAGTARLLRDAEAAYDCVFVDAPGLLPVPDARIVAAVADGTVVLVRDGRTKRGEVAGGVRALRQVGARVLGLVVTSADDAAYRGALPGETGDVAPWVVGVPRAAANGAGAREAEAVPGAARLDALRDPATTRPRRSRAPRPTEPLDDE